MIRTLARRLPRPVRDGIRQARKRYRSAHYSLRERFRPTVLTAGDVEQALRESGLLEGDACFVQAAMSSFGSFEDGADTVVGAVEAVVGNHGLISMPAFPLTGPAIEHLESDPVFDVRSTQSRMGAVSEAFRTGPQTLRSIHPTHSICARGPGAGKVVAGHETAPTPFGEGTPFPRIIECDALQLFLGCGTGVITMYHSFECTRRPPFPLDVFADRVFDARCVGWEGEEVNVRTLVHNPRLAPGRIDTNPRLQRVFREAILSAGGRSVTLGHGEILAIRLSALTAEFERLVERGVTIYDVRVPDRQPELPPQDRVAVAG